MDKLIFASNYAKLDSNVITGGGTDDTEALQAILDKAPEMGRLHLIMDGAALVRGLKLHSNTTIECMDKSCGFYLANNSNCAILTNHNPSYTERKTHNITLLGGRYNHNCLHQEHDIECSDINIASGIDSDKCEETLTEENALKSTKLVIAVEFYGIENLNIRDLTVRDQRTFAFTVGNFKHVNIENTYIELENEITYGNQDGFHFWGPGQFLTMRNIGGRTEDDFMNIGPDERDGVSDITDVLIDGVMLDAAWQGIRLLSRGTGRLDRVTIRNVTGEYRSLGFYINPWFISEQNGNFGNIIFENIDLRSIEDRMPPEYENPRFLFSIGGDIEALTLKNIYWHKPFDNRNLIQIGYPYYNTKCDFVKTPTLKTFTLDGLKIEEYNEDAADTEYIVSRGRIDHMVLRDIDIYRTDAEKNTGSFLHTCSDCSIGMLSLNRVYAENINTLLDLKDGKTELLIQHDVLLNNVENAICGTPEKTHGKEEKL